MQVHRYNTAAHGHVARIGHYVSLDHSQKSAISTHPDSTRRTRTRSGLWGVWTVYRVGKSPDSPPWPW